LSYFCSFVKGDVFFHPKVLQHAPNCINCSHTHVHIIEVLKRTMSEIF
jgi:hypothetical protein